MKPEKTHLWLGVPPAKDDQYPKTINIINGGSRISYVDLTLPKNVDLKFAYYKAAGNKKMAAKILGIGRTTLYNKLVEYGLNEEN